MPPRSRHAAAASAAPRVAAALCILATWSLCACAPTGDAGAAATTTEDDGLYRPPPPGEDGAYLPDADEQQDADDAGAYIPEKYETAESAGEGTYDAKKYESVEGFDDGMYHPPPDSQEHDDGSYHPEIAEKTVGDEGSYHISDENYVGDNGSYQPEQYEKSEGDNGLYDPHLYESVVGDEGAYHQEIAEKIVGDDGSYRPDANVGGESHEVDYKPEIYEKVVGDDGSYHGTKEDDGSYHSNINEQVDDGLYHPEIHERSESDEDGQLQGDVNSPVAGMGKGTPGTRVRRQQSDHTFQLESAGYNGHSASVSLSSSRNQESSGGVLDKPVANKRSAREAHSGVYGLQTLEEKMQQSDDDGEYHPERFETPAPAAEQDWDRYWTEAAATAEGGSATPTEDALEAADDGSYRAEHHKAEDYDEHADSGQDSATAPVEATEAADDGAYRPQQHTESPPEDYDERADNGTDWRDNVVEHHDEGTEAADDGSYRPQEHGPRERRGATGDTEEVQLSPVVFHVAPKPQPQPQPQPAAGASEGGARATPQSPPLPLPAPAV